MYLFTKGLANYAGIILCITSDFINTLCSRELSFRILRSCPPGRCKQCLHLLNRMLTLHNTGITSPVIANIRTNCYRAQTELFMEDDMILYSQEGTTQGDPLWMPIYALAIVSLSKLHEPNHVFRWCPCHGENQ